MWNDPYQQWHSVLEPVVDIICVWIEFKHVGENATDIWHTGSCEEPQCVSVTLYIAAHILFAENAERNNGRSRTEEGEMKVKLICIARYCRFLLPLCELDETQVKQENYAVMPTREQTLEWQIPLRFVVFPPSCMLMSGPKHPWLG